jgi:organic radical activating enzyme
MKIMEIFNSFQGEGHYMGRPCTFVRTAGCSLHCSFCDTKASWAEGTTDLTPADIAKACNMPLVVITGGEPTEQPMTELAQLIYLLHEAGKKVAIESNGTFEHYAELAADWVTCSPKANASYAIFMDGVDELKYVVTDDFNADMAIPETVRAKFAGHIWLQPCDYGDERTLNSRAKVYALTMADPRFRCGIQLHKWYGVQ